MMDLLWRRACEAQRKLLLMAICDCADDEGRAFPSQNYLTWKTELARSTITQYLKEFQQSGVIEVIGRRAELQTDIPGNSSRNTTVIQVNLERLPWKTPWKSGLYGDRTSGDGTSGYGTTGNGDRTSGGRSRNKEETSLEPSGGETPPDLHQLQYATRILEEIGMTHSRPNQDAARVAIELLVREGKSKPAAYEFLLAQARDAIDRGELVDRWWFEDAKWKRRSKATTPMANAADEARKQYAEIKKHAAGN